MTQEEAAQEVVDTCFWGDYTFDSGQILAGIEEGSDYFDRFLTSRIVDNATYASQLLRVLFGSDRAAAILSGIAGSGLTAGHVRRRKVVLANLTGDYPEIPGMSWTRKEG